MSKLRLLCASVAVLAACGTAPPDDTDVSSGASVKTVDCAAAAPAMTVTTVGNSYQPSGVRIPAGGVVRWMLPAQHDVASSTPGLRVDFGGNVCLQFMVAGQYSYQCSAHGFTGNVTVE